jgi:hypothetical protein
MKRDVKSSAGWVIVLSLGLCLASTAFASRHAIRWMLREGDNSNVESELAQIGLWAHQSGRLYPKLAESPYTPAPYGPLLYLGLESLALLFPDPPALIHAGRIIVFCSFVLLAGVAFAWCRRISGSVAAAWFSALLILSSLDFYPWAIAIRPDVPAVLLSILSVCLVCETESPRLRQLALSGSLIAAALLLKHTYLAAPAAIGLSLAWRREFRQLAIFIASIVVPIGVVLVWLIGKGEPVVQELLLYSGMALSPQTELAIIREGFYRFPAEAAVLSLAIAGLASATDSRRWQLLRLYSLLTVLVAIVTLMQIGGDLNYLVETWALASILAGVGFASLLAGWDSTPGAARLAVATFLVICLATGVDRWRDVPARPTSPTALAAVLHGKRVLSSNSYYTIQGVNPEMLDPFLNRGLELAGKWSPVPVIQTIRRHEYDFVVIALANGDFFTYRGSRFFSDSILGEIRQNYSCACVLGGAVAVYVRATEQDDPHTVNSLASAGCVPPQTTMPGCQRIPRLGQPGPR